MAIRIVLTPRAAATRVAWDGVTVPIWAVLKTAELRIRAGAARVGKGAVDQTELPPPPRGPLAHQEQRRKAVRQARKAVRQPRKAAREPRKAVHQTRKAVHQTRKAVRRATRGARPAPAERQRARRV
jgi:hypothetical protein